MLEKIAKWLTRKPKLVAMMAVLMLIPAAIGYISTRINYDILSYLPEDLESSHGEKLLEEPRLLKTPIVRNGRQATVGYHPEVWQNWS